MPTDTRSHDRRRFVTTVGGIGVAALIGAVVPRRSRADELPHLAETDPTASALGYREDAANVDAAKFPAHTAAQHCATCNFFQGGAAGYGPCQLFPGKAVSGKGWCSAYAAKPA